MNYISGPKDNTFDGGRRVTLKHSQYTPTTILKQHPNMHTNNLILNTEKITCTLFTPGPSEYNTKLNMQINNNTLDRNPPPKKKITGSHPRP